MTILSQIGNIFLILLFGLVNFKELAERIGVKPVRANRILTQALSREDAVGNMIDNSFLNDDTKKKYARSYLDKSIA